MALGSRLWRPVPVDCWEWLEDLSPLAQRAWFWLWTGPTSTPHGVVSVRPYHAAGALKTKPSALLVALSELEQAGRIVMQQGSPSRIDLYLVGYLPAQCPVRPVQRRGIKKGIERVDLGLPTSQALEEWASWDAACRKADDSLDPACAEPEPQQKQKQKQEQKPENKQETNASVAKATDTPALPDVTHAIAIEPQAGKQEPPKQSRYLSFDPNWPPETAAAPKRQSIKPTDRARPTFAEAVAYFREQDSTELEACKFCDYHDAGGWKIGRNPMKDWRAAARNWIRNASQYGQPRGTTSRTPAGKDWPTVEAKAPTSPVLDFEATPAASQADSWAEAEALKVWRKGGKVGPAPPSGGKRADYSQWLG
jgi:hypothetical protein